MADPREARLLASAARYPEPPREPVGGMGGGAHDVPVADAPPGVIVNTNFVCEATMGASAHVQDVVDALPVASCYIPARGQFRLKRPHAVCMAFPSGYFLMVGTRTPVQALLAAWKFVLMFRKAGVASASVAHFLVCNIASTASVGAWVDIFSFSKKDFPNVTATFETFPGCTIRSTGGTKAVFTVFTSGKFNIVGPPSLEQTRRIFSRVVARLGPYLRTTEAEIEDLKRRAHEARHGAARRRPKPAASDEEEEAGKAGEAGEAEEAADDTDPASDSASEAAPEADREVFLAAECPVCLEPLAGESKAVARPCGHLMHAACARRWAETSRRDTCVVCRRERRPAPAPKRARPSTAAEEVRRARPRLARDGERAMALERA